MNQKIEFSKKKILTQSSIYKKQLEKEIIRIEIELTSTCNLKCPLCIRSITDLPKSNQYREIEEIKSDLEKYVNLKYVTIAGAISEPLFAEVRELRQSVDSIAHEVALESLVHVKYENFPTVKALLARISMLRAFNRRARYALPWFSLRSSQEGSACFGGLSGFGASLEKAGRTWNTQANKMVRQYSVQMFELISSCTSHSLMFFAVDSSAIGIN